MPRTAHRPHSQQHRRQQGFTLLEVLVSVVILSLGLLGVAGLQAAALKYNRESQHMASAALLANDYIEQMRMQAQVQRRAGQAISLDDYILDRRNLPSPAPNSTPSVSSTHTASQQWLDRLARTLPNPRVQVCYESQPFDDSGKPKNWAACNTSEKAKGIVTIKLGWTQTVQTTDNSGTNQIQTAASVVPQLVMTYSFK